MLSQRLVRLTALTRLRPQHRTFALTPTLHKSATETVKDGLKTVDRAVSDNVLIPGLDAAEKVKETAQSVTSSDAKQKAAEVKGDVTAKARETAGQASAKAEELKGSAKGKAEEVKGQAAGKTEEVRNKL
ncbi:LEA domain-containing protein [Ophiocordyceps camponoti-floridani]|uniref:LEA domain-containing protein n=1 Tax=Ophiocordyceps camponoti-floridani TaxID=2030778 RepID=A0A8H4Q5C2_9HYPO|nr:LEA domain-containing protein [Ophiocordyceps camponoti-floridani]